MKTLNKHTKNGVFIKLNSILFRRRDGIFGSGLRAFVSQFVFRSRSFRTTGLSNPAFCRSFPSENQSQGLERNLGRRSPCGEAEPLASNPEVGFDASNTPHPGPVTREPLALISGLR